MITNLIFEGKDNAVTRAQLCAITGMTDRDVRKHIEQLRRVGHIIINNQDGKGYYISDDIDKIEKQYKQNKNRALSILVNQKFLRAKLRAAGRL